MRALIALITMATVMVVLACDEAGEDIPDSENTTPTRTVSDTQASSITPSSPSTLTAAPSNTATPSGWPKHTDSDLGFSFAYSPGLTIKEESQQVSAGGLPEVDALVVTLEGSSGVTAAGLSVIENPMGLALEEWIEIYPRMA
jgi:hypothetical protein